MSERKIDNAKITGTMLGYEDHGILSAMVFTEGDGCGQGFGGYALDGYNEVTKERKAGIHCGVFIQGVLKTLEIETWEKLKGTPCRIDHDWNKIYRIGHFLKDRWFDPASEFSKLEKP